MSEASVLTILKDSIVGMPRQGNVWTWVLTSLTAEVWSVVHGGFF